MLRSTNSSIFIAKNHNFHTVNQGFNNKDSPLKAVFRGISPQKSLSPLKGKQQKNKNTRCHSPHLMTNINPSTSNVQRNIPLIVSTRKDALFSVQNYTQDNDLVRSPRNMKALKSFREVSQRNSQQVNDYSFQNSIGYRSTAPNNYNQTQYLSKRGYQQIQANPKSNTKIFSQLLCDLQFNRATSQQQQNNRLNGKQSNFKKNYQNRDHSDSSIPSHPSEQNSPTNNMKNEQRREQRSFKNIMFNDVQTIQSIQSIQSPQQAVMNARYAHHPFIKKKSYKQEPKTQKIPTQEQFHKIDFDLTNSFGSTIKRDIMGEMKKLQIQINPFQQIEKEQENRDKQLVSFKQIKLTDIKPFANSESFSLQLSSFQKFDILGSIDKENSEQIYEEQDSDLGAFIVIIEHFRKKQNIGTKQSHNLLQSVNISKDNQQDSLNMNPFL